MIKIMLDPGHGRQNRGFLKVQGYPYCNEGEANYDYAVSYLKPALEARGFFVGVTKTSMGEDPSLQYRGSLANGYDMLLSLHTNAAGGTGTEIWDSVNPKEKLTTFFGELSKEIAKAVGTNDRGVKYRKNSSGGNYYGILRAGKAKHNAIIEHVFHDNRSDVEKYVKNMRQIAEATANKLAEFYGKKQVTDTPVQSNDLSIMGKSVATAEQLATYLIQNNPNPAINTSIDELARLFIQEGEIEGVRGDIAFAQAIKETGFFRYGGDVVPEQNNYAGIGTTGGGVRGAYFPTPQMGVQAQIQHLKAYASTEPLYQMQVDPRFHLVKRGVAPTLTSLNGKWAVPGRGYGEDIQKILEKIISTKPIMMFEKNEPIESPVEPQKEEVRPITLFIHEKPSKAHILTLEGVSYIDVNNTLIPVRNFFETLGFEVVWEDNSIYIR